MGDLDLNSSGPYRARKCILAGLAFALTWSGAGAGGTAEDRLLKERLAAHIAFLADDLLRGRQPGTEGYDLAAAYVASHYRQMGLVPAGDNGSYYQQVPLRRAYLKDGSAHLDVSVGGARTEFTFIEQFYTAPAIVHEKADVTAPTVFAGYGIHAPELGYSDFEGLDVSGKIVVSLTGMPAGFPSEEGAHFASSREKLGAAAGHGAVGLLRIHTPRRDRRVSWERYKSRVGAPAMAWLGEGGKPSTGFPQLRASLLLHHASAGVLFEGTEYSIAQLIELDEAGQRLPAFALNGIVRARQSSTHDLLTSPNVAGVLPGSDPLLGNEYLVYTAHLDHIGELHGGRHGDTINNGALDNASGISVMLETARHFTGGTRPRRSILFLAVTAEEKGLVGSEYFASNPTVALDAMVGAINLDMPLLLYDFGDVIAFGAEHSTLGESVRQAAGEFGVGLSPDPMPEQNIFVRSDHYRFVQQGIPAIFLVTGTQSRDGKTDTQALFEAFLKDHYHRPSDDLNLPIDYDAASRFTRINARIGEIVANDPVRPAWREGDFFGTLFGR